MRVATMTPWKLCLGALLALAVACGLMALVTMPAKAQLAPPQCGPAETVFGNLAARFGERPAIVLNSQSGQFVLTVSDAGVWTLVFIRPDGLACLTADGDSIRRTPSEKAKGTDS